eukprot:TRINITY_DN7506_c2_g1_i3.p1 TRINITY_DN7506_c2_g1~~TRINITY_DN7506_c2_g1_i3.p1  ORF type:complete len:219 (+),score=82.04 TRINITY_DN7506_c2_g1_i3:34-690(+)
MRGTEVRRQSVATPMLPQAAARARSSTVALTPQGLPIVLPPLSGLDSDGLHTPDEPSPPPSTLSAAKTFHDIGELSYSAWDPDRETMQFAARVPRSYDDAVQFAELGAALVQRSGVSMTDDVKEWTRFHGRFSAKVEAAIKEVWARDDRRTKARAARALEEEAEPLRRRMMQTKQRREGYVKHLAQKSKVVFEDPHVAKGTAQKQVRMSVASRSPDET